MTDAELTVVLANAGAPVRPIGARAATRTKPLRDPIAASELLGPFLGREVTGDELPALRVLRRAVAATVEALIDGAKPVPLSAINRLAASHRGVYSLEQGPDGRLVAALCFDRAPAAAELATRAIRELGCLDPGRLRRCARPECSLVFYDTTRSSTQRWHADSPCGNRERQRRHRQRTTTSLPPIEQPAGGRRSAPAPRAR